MATIVEHKETRMRYILLGAGLGMYGEVMDGAKPFKAILNNSAWEARGHLSIVSVCNSEGEIGLFNMDELTVVSVDGVSPESILLS